MAVTEKVVKAGKTRMVTQSRKTGNHSGPREKRGNETSEAQKEGNFRRAVQNLTALMNTNFEDGDLLITADYRKGLRPADSGRMHKDFDNLLSRMKRKLKKLGLPPPKYIRVVEVGPRGARHHHIVMKNFPCALEILRECWKEGGINIKPLFTDGNYRGIAEYFVKYSKQTYATEGKESKKLWYPARGLKKPKISKPREIKSREIGQIKIPKGYYLDQDSVRHGISRFDGHETFFYILVRLPDYKPGKKKRMRAERAG